MSVTECEVHEWVKAEESWACSQCVATSATCAQGDHPANSSIPLCLRCQVRIAQRIRQLDAYLRLALVAEVAQSDLKSPMDYRMRVSGSCIQHEAEGAEGIEEVMLGWGGMWAEYVGAENAGWADFLTTHLLWAVQHPNESGWEDFAREVGAHRLTAQHLAGLGPARLPERCVYCKPLGHKGELVQDRVDRHGEPYADGLQDEVRCLTCDRHWEDRQAYQLVTRMHITASEGEVTIEQAKELWPEVPAATWRRWKKRGDLEATGGTHSLASLRALVTRRREELGRLGGGEQSA